MVDQCVSWHDFFLRTSHDDDEPIGGWFRSNVDVRIVLSDHVADERALAHAVLTNHQYHRLGLETDLVESTVNNSLRSILQLLLLQEFILTIYLFCPLPSEKGQKLKKNVRLYCLP